MAERIATTPTNDFVVKAVIYKLELSEETADEKETHSILSIPCVLANAISSKSFPALNESFYNIAMFDVSGSMCEVWEHVMDGWNDYMAPTLTGDTDIYTFGSEVTFRRRGTTLENSDNDSSMTDLTEALRTIKSKVSSCSHKRVRVFLVTDGHHNCGSDTPQSEIENMSIPSGKIVEVYLLGVGQSFPVQYSVDIRSRLHNGSASCPTIFWSQECQRKDVFLEMSHIQEEMKKGMTKVKLSIPAQVLPLVSELKSEVHAGEFLYYDREPQKLLAQLQLCTEDGMPLDISPDVIPASAEFLVSYLFKQWNAVLLQRHRNKLDLPMDVFDLMQKAFDIQMFKFKESPKENIQKRLRDKHINSLRVDFSTLMNQSRSVISIESKFKNEIELAQAILKTTVQSRFDTKLLKMRGHGDSEWETDVEAFKEKYKSIEAEIKALPEPREDDCCRVLICSFVGDLQDPDFIKLLDENKMNFLMNMSFTGIPIYAPVKDSAQINPWTLYIKNICVSPYEILSQRSMESSFAIGATNTTSPDKEITLQADNPLSIYNAIVPIIPEEHCQLLKRLVRTNLFSVGATFCILKNALIVDHNCHFAALSCVWMKTVKDYPFDARPQFIKKRISSVEGTAKLYLDRKGYSLYVKALLENPKLALMTEANEEYEGVVLKCESMVKPAFMLHLSRDVIISSLNPSVCSRRAVVDVLQLMLVEFLGRCLSSNTSTTPYMDHFVPGFAEDDRKKWLDEITKTVLNSVHLTGESLLQSCFIPEELSSHTRAAVRGLLDTALEDGTDLCSRAAPNMDNVVRLRNSGSAGHVGWTDLQAWATEVTRAGLLTQEDVDLAFSTEKVTSYLHHALQQRSSKDRLTVPLSSPEQSLKAVREKLAVEQQYYLKTHLLSSVDQLAKDLWHEAYDASHTALAQPLSPQQIVCRARERGVEVTEETFKQVYKYRPNVGLCRNACHVESCPHFLKPDRRFNCHIEAERRHPEYLHALHLVVSQHHKSPDTSIELISSGCETGSNNRRKKTIVFTPEGEQKLRFYVTELDKVYDNLVIS